MQEYSPSLSVCPFWCKDQRTFDSENPQPSSGTTAEEPVENQLLLLDKIDKKSTWCVPRENSQVAHGLAFPMICGLIFAFLPPPTTERGGCL